MTRCHLKTSRYTTDIKRSILRIHKLGMSIAEVSRRTGIPAGTIRSWKARLSAHGGSGGEAPNGDVRAERHICELTDIVIAALYVSDQVALGAYRTDNENGCDSPFDARQLAQTSCYQVPRVTEVSTSLPLTALPPPPAMMLDSSPYHARANGYL